MGMAENAAEIGWRQNPRPLARMSARGGEFLVAETGIKRAKIKRRRSAGKK